MTIQTSINANTFTPMPQFLGGTGVNTPTTISTAGEYSAWDVNENLSFNNYVSGQTITPTAAGTTTLTVASAYQQFFTGASTQTVHMPVVSTLALGMQYLLVNLSSGNVTINSSGGNLIVTLPANSQATLTCISLSGTTAASWSSDYSLTIAGVASITGTANQVIALPSTGNVVLSLPQSIATSSSPTFAALTLTNPHIVGAGGLVNIQILTSGTAATYTKTAGATAILIEMVGGGGGGGGSLGAPASVSAGAPGAAGGYTRLYVTSAASTYTYTIGAGGTAGPSGNNAGGTGGTTTFSAGLGLQATGGAGGQGMASTPNAQSNSRPASAGGFALNGNINIAGAPGAGSFVALGNANPGVGGSSHYGGGGISGGIGAGGSGQNYGSGGSGGVSTTTSFSGGAGSGGLIIVYEFA